MKKEKSRPREQFRSIDVAISELGDQKLPLIKPGTTLQESITESLVNEFPFEEKD